MVRDRNQKAEQGSETLNLEQLQRRLAMLDERLDNLDSMITAVVERVMSQAVTLHLSCPRCGKDIEIGIIGTKKPTA